MREALPKCWQGKETPKDLYLFKSCHGIKSYFLIQQLEKQMIGCQQIISFILHVIGWVMLGPLGWVGCRRGKTRHFSKGSPRWGRDTQLDHPSALPECLQFEVAHPNVQVIWYGRTQISSSFLFTCVKRKGLGGGAMAATLICFLEYLFISTFELCTMYIDLTFGRKIWLSC